MSGTESDSEQETDVEDDIDEFKFRRHQGSRNDNVTFTDLHLTKLCRSRGINAEVGFLADWTVFFYRETISWNFPRTEEQQYRYKGGPHWSFDTEGLLTQLASAIRSNDISEYSRLFYHGILLSPDFRPTNWDSKWVANMFKCLHCLFEYERYAYIECLISDSTGEHVSEVYHRSFLDPEHTEYLVREFETRYIFDELGYNSLGLDQDGDPYEPGAYVFGDSPAPRELIATEVEMPVAAQLTTDDMRRIKNDGNLINQFMAPLPAIPCKWVLEVNEAHAKVLWGYHQAYDAVAFAHSFIEDEIQFSWPANQSLYSNPTMRLMEDALHEMHKKRLIGREEFVSCYNSMSFAQLSGENIRLGIGHGLKRKHGEDRGLEILRTWIQTGREIKQRRA